MHKVIHTKLKTSHYATVVVIGTAIVVTIYLVDNILRNPIVKTVVMQRNDHLVNIEENTLHGWHDRLDQEIRGLIEQSDFPLLNENANKDARVIPTQRDLLAGIVARQYAKQHMLPSDVVLAHEKGEIHYHDLDYAPFFPMFNCMLVDLEGMLTHGFKMGNAEIEPPKSISTATAVTAQIIAQVASHIYGGTTIDRIDEVLAPFVKASYHKHLIIAEEWQIADKKAYAESRTEKECYDAFQSLEYEVNTLHTANGQTPFVTFGFGLGTSEESRLIQTAILRNRLAGLGKNRKTAVFPKLVFAIRDGLNHRFGDPNYDIKLLALECASKRMYPDILNYDQVIKVTGSFKTPMGCRSFLGVYEKNGQKIHAGRNNLGVISLNLPRIAIEAKGNEMRFWQLLDQRLLVARKALMTRIERLESTKARVAPILYMEGACGVRLKEDDNVAEIFKHGRASISLGYIGIHETINALYGNHTHLFDNEQRRQKALAIVKHLRKATDEWKQQTGYGFSLYSTPSESLCDRFCRLDVAEFGVISGVTDKGYYTNSFHLDVEKKVNPYDKLDFEAPYPPLANGGFICYGEYPNLQHNLKALEDVWDYSYSRVPYYGTNTPIDECYQCGFTGEFSCASKGFTCPACGNHDSAEVSVIRRVCGYLGSPDARPFNTGKQEEVKRRIKHLNHGHIG
ncbi:anaerobic ribonucleoside-triphosphate reductase [Xenorhabdus sp. PB30.3]|uniref:anaerobic ribonucleoside-triphosphate reductase n=1 Tax=Xenorhabdus sp. PB30.3 TaxID=2788941 RepID=UPI002105B8A4|nr:anaerobic ribonucleoside-triphosphate reductase [Xenorhabdus sp. PB30.3]MCC8381275.1 anaerobic ribonucleoside-triphosphate reductase [Xenorhabdus sp. PB30.3]